MRATAIIAMVALALAALATGAAAETLSKSTAKITQLKIAHSGNDGYGAPTGKGYPCPAPRARPERRPRNSRPRGEYTPTTSAPATSTG